MTNGYKAIKDQIVSILGTVGSLNIVYSKEAKALNDGGYPAATVQAKSHGNEFYTVGPGGSNKRSYQHYIRVYFRTDEKNDPDYEDVLTATVDDVTVAFDQNVQLNGIVDFSVLSSGDWKDGQKENPVRYCELVLMSTVRVNR